MCFLSNAFFVENTTDSLLKDDTASNSFANRSAIVGYVFASSFEFLGLFIKNMHGILPVMKCIYETENQ